MTALLRTLADLRDRGGLLGKDIANITGVSTPTVSRWTTGAASPPLETQTALAALRYVVDRLFEFYAPQEIRVWLHTPHPLLDGARAIDLVNAGRVAEVLAVIERMDAGAFV